MSKLGFSLSGCATLLIRLLLLHVVNAKRQQSSASVYAAKTTSCTPSLFNKRDILNERRSSRGKIDCVRQCSVNIKCVLVVYREYSDGSETCTELSDTNANSSVPFVVSVSNLHRCVGMFVSPCLNGGQLYAGVCLCKSGFTGQACEYSNPSVCSVVWSEFAAINKTSVTVQTNGDIREFGHTNTKVLLRDKILNVVSVMKGVAADRDLQYGDKYWYLETFPFFEKASWNQFAVAPQREMLHFITVGSVQRLSFNGSSGKYEYNLFDNSLEFSFFTPRQTKFSTVRNMPGDLMMLKDDLSSGYEIFQATMTYQDDSEQAIVTQIADRLWDIQKGGHFMNPPTLYNVKHVLGLSTSRTRTDIGKGIFKEVGNINPKTSCYINPCWVSMNDDIYVGKASFKGWKMLGTYLRLGNDIRIQVGRSYHTVLEVIQIGESYVFILAPFLSQYDTSTFTSDLKGVRSLVTSSGECQICEHQIEGENITAQYNYTSPFNVIWFVDTRMWNKVLVVSSNSSVMSGSVANLGKFVKKGYDVRIWIQWLISGVSRFLDTHMSSVTDDGKISTESMVTWQTTKGTSVRLSSRCNMEYILVTSEGRVEILTFNYLTPGRSEVQSDVIITWFLA